MKISIGGGVFLPLLAVLWAERNRSLNGAEGLLIDPEDLDAAEELLPEAGDWDLPCWDDMIATPVEDD